MQVLFGVTLGIKLSRQHINKSCLRFQKRPWGVVLLSTAKDALLHVKNLSVLNVWNGMRRSFLRKTTATLQQLPRARFFCFVQVFEFIKDVVSGGGSAATLGLRNPQPDSAPVTLCQLSSCASAQNIHRTPLECSVGSARIPRCSSRLRTPRACLHTSIVQYLTTPNLEWPDWFCEMHVPFSIIRTAALFVGNHWWPSDEWNAFDASLFTAAHRIA